MDPAGLREKVLAGRGSLLAGLMCSVTEGYALEYREGKEESITNCRNANKHTQY